LTFNFALLFAAVAFAGCGGGTDQGRILGGGPQVKFSQVDRLNRPAVNEVFASFARHDPNNRDTPADDPNPANLKGDILNFMTTVAGRSTAISTTVASVLTPDVQIADLSVPGQSCIGTAPGACSNYLGVETGGKASPQGSTFGGRALTDDIVDISLSVIFGKTIPALGLAPEDNNEQDGRTDASFTSGHRPNLTTDNVSYLTAPKHFTPTFPYVGAPQ
nr:DUF4331 domain-containing protein [Candidatus Eremiobacteraeota bacterium]